jgi:hypothetical protein
MMISTGVITAMVCYTCDRNLLLTSTDTWTDIISDKPPTSSWIYITLVYCDDCLHAGLKVPTVEFVMPKSVWDVSACLNMSNHRPTIVHSTKRTYASPQSGTRTFVDLSGSDVSIENVHTVMSGMGPRYTVSSVRNSLMSDPYEDFIMCGPVYTMELPLYSSTLTVNNVLICPMCWRNVIFAGKCSTMDASEFAVRGKCLNLIMYTRCAICKDPSGTDEQDRELVLEALDLDVVKTSGAVVSISRVLGNDVYIYKDAYNHGIKVVPADIVLQRLAFNTERYSLVHGVKKAPCSDFL